MKRFVPDRETLRSPLARRLIFTIVLASSAITLCLTALQLYGEYRGGLEGIEDDFRRIEKVHLKSLSQSLWTADRPELLLQIEGIVHLPNLEYIVVREGDRYLAQAGRRVSSNIIERQYPLTYVHRGQTLEIGMLTVVAGIDAIYRGLVKRAFIVLAGNAFKTFLVAGFAFALFYWLVSRHLLYIAAYLRGLDMRGRVPPLILERAAVRRPDELDEVAVQLNQALGAQQAAQAQLRESEERLRQRALIFENATDAIMVLDPQRRILDWNPASKRLFGYRKDEVLGRNTEFLSRPDDYAKYTPLIDATIARGERWVMERVMLCKDGTERICETIRAPLLDAGGTLIGRIGLSRDITERRRTEQALREREHLMRLVTENVPAMIAYFDTGLICRFANTAFCKFHRVDPQDAIGMSVRDITGDDTYRVVSPGIDLVKSGKPVTMRRQARAENGEIRHIEIHRVPDVSPEGAFRGYYAMLLDITERQQAERALQAAHARLRELSHRLQEVEATERNAISRELHDRLGQGLSTLSLMVGALGVRLPKEAQSAVRTQLKDIQALLRSVAAHVRDVMAELRPPVLDDYGLLAALRHLATEFAKRTRISAELSGVELHPRLPLIVETAMFRIIQEALNNIVKHARAKKVAISLNAVSDRVVLDIADDGAGFDASNTPDGGKHWGMITMRERAEAVGITFRLESAPGAGTRVVLEVERAAS